MQSKKKRKSCILVIIGLFFIPSILINVKLNVKSEDFSQFNSEIRDLHVSKIYGKIYINNNWSDAKTAGLCTGSGNFSDPYIIEDLIIDARGTGSGILIESSIVYFIIENCTIINSRSGVPPSYGAGISLDGVGNGTIKNNNISLNDIGIFINGNNNSISQNHVFNNLGGIFTVGYGFNEIFENNISHNLIGFWGISFNGCNFSYNLVKENQQYGIFLYYSLNSSIIENSIISNNGSGILLFESSYDNISKNKIINNTNYGILSRLSSPFIGDPFPRPTYTYISENIITKNTYGIMLNYTTNNSILNNTVNNNEVSGVELHFSDSNAISDNIITGNYHGIKCNESKFNEINQNMISNNYYGISLISSYKNNIVQNTINYNHYGISFTSSIRNEIISNTLHYNWMCFIEDQDSYYNNFENNDCIETRKKAQDWIGSLLITTSVTTPLLGLAIIIILYRRYKRRLK
ncbi:MAG: nitrous oxide reductase family maturation protein NosD [Promethearchaeota archaeon]